MRKNLETGWAGGTRSRRPVTEEPSAHNSSGTRLQRLPARAALPSRQLSHESPPPRGHCYEERENTHDGHREQRPTFHPIMVDPLRHRMSVQCSSSSFHHVHRASRSLRHPTRSAPPRTQPLERLTLLVRLRITFSELYGIPRLVVVVPRSEAEELKFVRRERQHIHLMWIQVRLRNVVKEERRTMGSAYRERLRSENAGRPRNVDMSISRST